MIRRWGPTGVLVLLGSLLGLWAGRVLLLPPSDPAAEAPASLEYTVEQGTLSDTLSLQATGEWETSPVLHAGVSGVVTTVDVPPGAEVASGDQLGSVGLAPIIVVSGEIPASRTMSAGDTGADVRQLQQFLVDAGHLNLAPDGRFGASTTAAVKEWQAATGLPDSGRVELGQVLFVPDLPAEIVLSSDVRVGATLANGTSLLARLASRPDFTIRLPTNQSRLIPKAAGVVVDAFPGWELEVAGTERDPATTELLVRLEPANRERPCPRDCREVVPVGQTVSLDVRVILTPETTGPILPAAALTTQADGTVVVTLPDGENVAVTVEAIVDGQAVVSGIDTGTRILLPSPDTAADDG